MLQLNPLLINLLLKSKQQNTELVMVVIQRSISNKITKANLIQRKGTKHNKIQYLSTLIVSRIATPFTTTTNHSPPLQNLIIHIRIRRQWRRAGSNIHTTAAIGPELRRGNGLQGTRIGDDLNSIWGPFLNPNFPFVLSSSRNEIIVRRREINQTPGFEEQIDLVNQSEVAHKRLADLGECEPSRRILTVFSDDEVSVFFVYFGSCCD